MPKFSVPTWRAGEGAALRYPWTKYARTAMVGPATTAYNYRVGWTVPDSTPGLYGWRSEIRLFADEAVARAAAAAPMGVAKEVRLDRLDWNTDRTRLVAAPTIYSRRNANYAKRAGAR